MVISHDDTAFLFSILPPHDLEFVHAASCFYTLTTHRFHLLLLLFVSFDMNRYLRGFSDLYIETRTEISDSVTITVAVVQVYPTEARACLSGSRQWLLLCFVGLGTLLLFDFRFQSHISHFIDRCLKETLVIY
ncbi:hypothetical protein L1987_80364 [Smallanthus sonchifolius]|uniref:Uncharacterized protein n=1 Tax=Smallanthus sonchifolius TaxID=185202 RepID=A0ACB8YNK4_9ASTR|nr:hypothetical protein L1987_80364 [Smallanthus sonchifolius]